MSNKIENSIIAFLILGLLLEISGNGIVSIIQCSGRYNISRCINIDDDSPEIMMEDFFYLVKSKELDRSWNLLSDNLKYYFTHLENGIDGKNYFYNFWDIEINDFNLKEIKTSFISNNTVKVKIDICYKRNHSYAKDNNLSLEFCSNDYYTLIKKRNDINSPYLWSIDTYCWKDCENKVMSVRKK